MVSIKGIQLKNVKEFAGMEDKGFTASIYMDGKKIGTAVDYGYGGEVNIAIDEKERENEFYKRCDDFFSKMNQTLIAYDIFLGKIRVMMDLEKNFKKFQKNAAGRPFIMAVTKNVLSFELGDKTYTAYDYGTIYTWNGGDIDRAIAKTKEAERKDVDVEIFTKLEDFNL